MSINDYHMKVKKIADALASIGSPVEDDEEAEVEEADLEAMVEIRICS